MKKCKDCQREIDEKAKKCPFCQTDQRKWFAKHPILTGILVLFVIIFVSGIAGSGNKNNTQPTTTGSNNATKPAPTAEKISVRDLADDFDSNQVAAEAKWKNKLVEFSSQISNITDTGISFYNVATKQFSGTQISCKVQDKQQLLPLKNGQTVTVKGVVGSQTIGVIGVDDCEVVK